MPGGRTPACSYGPSWIEIGLTAQPPIAISSTSKCRASAIAGLPLALVAWSVPLSFSPDRNVHSDTIPGTLRRFVHTRIPMHGLHMDTCDSHFALPHRQKSWLRRGP